MPDPSSHLLAIGPCPRTFGLNRHVPRHTCRSVDATLSALTPRLREVVILVYCLLGGRSARLNDERRRLLLRALWQIERRSDLRPFQRAEVRAMRAIRRRLAADLGCPGTCQGASHAA
jgi:hypothetical protein